MSMAIVAHFCPQLHALLLKGVLRRGKDQASIVSILFFNWIGPLVQLAYTQPLSLEHLYPLPSKSSTSALLTRFEKAWAEQLAKPEGQRR